MVHVSLGIGGALRELQKTRGCFYSPIYIYTNMKNNSLSRTHVTGPLTAASEPPTSGKKKKRTTNDSQHLKFSHKAGAALRAHSYTRLLLWLRLHEL